MATGDGWTSRLIAGLAGHLAASGVGVWRTNGVYTADEVGILDRAIPQQPDRVITLSGYPVDDGYPGLADFTQGVQIRIRGTTDPRVADDIADQVFDLLDSAQHFVVGGIHVVLAKRRSYASLGQDSNQRWERSDNYYLDAMRPTAHRTD